jgi:hypothetical protein
MRPTIAAMLRLVASLRSEPRFDDVAPSVSLASVNLKINNSARYVVVSWNEERPKNYEISFVDPLMEFSGTKQVKEVDIISIIDEYLNDLRKNKCSPHRLR